MEYPTLYQVKYTLEHLDVIDGDASTQYVEDAIKALETAKEALNTIGVKGQENLDRLLGIMLGIDMILGKNDEKE